MVYKILLCEDEPLFRESLRQEIAKRFEEKGVQCEFLCTANGAEFEKQIQTVTPDLLFMDIELGDKDGMDLIAAYRKNGGQKVPVIFVSGMEDRVLEGYEVSALAFLYKRNYRDKLERTLERFFKEYAEAVRITICAGSTVNVLGVQEIYFVETDGRKTLIHTGQGSLSEDKPIGVFMKELPETLFFEVYKAIYVNLEHIVRIDEDMVILDNGAKVVISRRKRKAAMAAVMQYIGGHGPYGN